MSDFLIARNGQRSVPHSGTEIRKRSSGNPVQPTGLRWTKGVTPVFGIFRRKIAPMSGMPGGHSGKMKKTDSGASAVIAGHYRG
jgi:hypothetical protein